MKKMMLVALILMMSLSTACTQSCGNGTENIKINGDETKVSDPSKSTGENGQATTKPEDTATKKPDDQTTTTPENSLVTDTSDIPEATIEPYAQSQMLGAMKLVPPETFDITNTANIAILLFGNVKATVARLNLSPDRDIEEMIRYAPPMVQNVMKQPLNDFERIQNLSWTVSSMTTMTSWMAGDLGVNMNMIPMMTKEKYKKYPLVYDYTAFKAPPEKAGNSRYGDFVVPLADSLVLLSGSDITDLAKKAVLNISEKGNGMLTNADYAKFLSYVGDPEACALIRNESSYDEVFPAKKGQPNLPPGVKEPPKQYILMQNAVDELKQYTRTRKLKYIGVGFYPNEQYNLRFTLYYEDASVVKEDMAKLREFWNKPILKDVEIWRNEVGLKETKFSVKDNLGFVECKINSKLSGITVTTEVALGIAMNALLSFVKQ